MSEPLDVPRSKSEPAIDDQSTLHLGTSLESNDSMDPPTPALTPGYASSSPSSPMLLSRNSSYVGSQSLQEDWETPLDRLTFFDIFDNLALPSRLEKLQATLTEQRDKLKTRRERMAAEARNKAVSEWRKRVPSSEEQLARYRSRLKKSVDGLNKRWSETVTISIKEKISFISAVLNVFISGYLIGATPDYFYYWFTVQLCYFMPVRLITYHRKGYHYFLADLCYFVNALCLLTIWAFPQSKRLFIATYCLAYGNNAVAIVMWRNSLVFHSMDKVVSLFIHVMPPVTLHCIVHLTGREELKERFPGAYAIKYSTPESPVHYSLLSMLFFSSVFYAAWQFTYHFFISIRRAEKIAAGRPTSFTWLRKSYSRTWIGKFVLARSEALQEPTFMLIQYLYALLTILPCPIWFWYRWASAAFLIIVFTWSIWNGATYYMDVFGKRFQKELEQMKRDVTKWQDANGMLSPPSQAMDSTEEAARKKRESLDKIPLLDETGEPKSADVKAAAQASTLRASGADVAVNTSATERKTPSSLLGMPASTDD
ncbi:uncharacterized protein HMPREF1541_04739 [Cyphellophora europaea CBS 101466]|uniref:Glycerophosphocholine acyltransferase 1 n=1 Tax=Cyphellophora europaea (strain CBS 101466) TaxID=1220924 RepID=W2RVK3_CYPE1|nr:uncharacterized protein HMPREF1541_04739 [Cyphellophora europaea CBS 101466]ETN40462.1 hypothetical protein HMPREF1541_04739 [Cyphellophora europaea CBS 101466]